MAKNREPVEIEVEVIRHGESAVLVSDGEHEAWIPYSLIDIASEITEDSDALDTGILVIPQWKAEDTGLV